MVFLKYPVIDLISTDDNDVPNHQYSMTKLSSQFIRVCYYYGKYYMLYYCKLKILAEYYIYDQLKQHYNNDIIIIAINFYKLRIIIGKLNNTLCIKLTNNIISFE